MKLHSLTLQGSNSEPRASDEGVLCTAPPDLGFPATRSFRTLEGLFHGSPRGPLTSYRTNKDTVGYRALAAEVPGHRQKRLPPPLDRISDNTCVIDGSEVANYEPVTVAADLWALGVITYVLLSGLSPFLGDNDGETFANITQVKVTFDEEVIHQVPHKTNLNFHGFVLLENAQRVTFANNYKRQIIDDVQ